MTTTIADRVGQELRDQYPGLFLGNVVWYHVPTNLDVKTKDWIGAVKSVGLEEMAPTKPRAVDAFKRAMSKNGRGGKVTLMIDGEDVTFKFMSRDSGHNDDMVYRELVVERLGANKLTYGPVVKFSFARSTARMEHVVDDDILDLIPTDVRTEVQLRIDAAYAQYERERYALGDTKVRELMREEIEDRQFGIICKPSGGVYFVFDTYNDRTQKLMQLFEMLGQHGLSMHSIPVADVNQQREMIIQAFENGTLGEVEQLMYDMKETLDGNRGTITKKVAAGYINDFKRLNDRMSAFSDELEQAFEGVSARMEIMRAQTLKIAQNIEIKS